ncbi:hypothetical protein BJV77DRAFT_774465 [Russula vinacea]|nr:hypothetical protein BJV77DRAFT_774465 [Russula vinacea]
MPQTEHPDLEGGRNPGLVDGHRSQRPSTPNRPLRPFQGEYAYSDSSWTLYSLYSKIADDEDNKMVERCQRDADGTLIFAGLFSATVGALLTLSFPDLKPNSQDTSAFYLQNLYQLQFSGNSNVSHPSTPSALAKPPAFSPPRYVIWVNSLWFLSLTVSLSGALVAILFRNWAVQYISITHTLWSTLPRRARMRALFAKASPGPNIIWGTGLEADYLHFSLLLFITGGLIYLFNINRTVFYAVVWWVVWITLYYTMQTVAVFYKPYALFHTPLSEVALSIYLGTSYAVFQICSCIPPLHGLRDKIRSHYRDLSEHYDDGILKGKRKQIEEIAFKASSEIDTQVLKQLLLALDEDPALETFFDAIPGYCSSKLCSFPPLIRRCFDKYWMDS